MQAASAAHLRPTRARRPPARSLARDAHRTASRQTSCSVPDTSRPLAALKHADFLKHLLADECVERDGARRPRANDGDSPDATRLECHGLVRLVRGRARSQLLSLGPYHAMRRAMAAVPHAELRAPSVLEEGSRLQPPPRHIRPAWTDEARFTEQNVRYDYASTFLNQLSVQL